MNFSFIRTSRSIRLAVLAAVAAAAVVVSGGASTRQADAAAPQVFVLQNKATSFVLDSNASRSVYTSGANGGSYQSWRLLNVPQ